MSEFNMNDLFGASSGEFGGFHSNGGMKYNVDICFVIDATGSMGMDNLIDTVKKMIPTFHKIVVSELNKKNKSVDVLRTRVVFFRDFVAYMTDGNNPLVQTQFYTLSDGQTDQSAALSSLLAGIKACGGGDIPEDGLEALACAIKSDWCPKDPNHKRRHIIVFFTDAPTHPIGYAASRCNIYPTGMPRSFEELTELWWNMDSQAKRLILFLPELRKLEKNYPNDDYLKIVSGSMPWENCDVTQVKSEEQFRELGFQSIVDRIVNSI